MQDQGYERRHCPCCHIETLHRKLQKGEFIAYVCVPCATTDAFQALLEINTEEKFSTGAHDAGQYKM